MLYNRLWLVTLAKSTVNHVVTYIYIYLLTYLTPTTACLHLFHSRTFHDKWHRYFNGPDALLVTQRNQQCQGTEGKSKSKHWPQPVAWPLHLPPDSWRKGVAPCKPAIPREYHYHLRINSNINVSVNVNIISPSYPVFFGNKEVSVCISNISTVAARLKLIFTKFACSMERGCAKRLPSTRFEQGGCYGSW